MLWVYHQLIGATFSASTIVYQPNQHRSLGANMHTVILELNCNPGMRDILLQALSASLGDTRAYKGCQLVETYVDVDNENRVILYEKWDQRESQEVYMQWRASTGMTEAMAPILAEPVRLLHFASHSA